MFLFPREFANKKVKQEDSKEKDSKEKETLLATKSSEFKGFN